MLGDTHHVSRVASLVSPGNDGSLCLWCMGSWKMNCRSTEMSGVNPNNHSVGVLQPRLLWARWFRRKHTHCSASDHSSRGAPEWFNRLLTHSFMFLHLFSAGFCHCWRPLLCQFPITSVLRMSNTCLLSWAFAWSLINRFMAPCLRISSMSAKANSLSDCPMGWAELCLDLTPMKCCATIDPSSR